MSARTTSLIGLYAVVAAATAAVIAPLVALAYFATADGAEYLEVATVAAWAEPARSLLGELVTWASADRVYATYSQVMALMFPAVLLTALAARSHRPQPRRRAERIGWRTALIGYGLFGAGLLAVAILLIPGDTSGALVDVAFLALMIPGLLLSVIGSTILGIVFLRSGHRPRLTAWLLTLCIPLLVVGSGVLGHNGLGLVPLMIAWAAAGWRLRTAQETPTSGSTDSVPAWRAGTVAGMSGRMLIALAALALLAAGCGDDGAVQGDDGPVQTADDTAGNSIPKDESIALVTERCAQVNEAFGELDFEEEPGRVAEELEGFVADIRDLPPPDENQDALASLLSALEDSAESWRAAQEAPAEGRGEAVDAAFASFGPAEEAAVAFGIGALEDCGREAAAADPDAHRIDVTAQEYEFDIPDTVPAGRVAFVLRNDGGEPHHMVVVRFKGEETTDEVLAAEQTGEDAGDYVDDIGDSPAALPGEETVLNAEVSAGRYAILCFISASDGEPHALKGMHEEFTVA